MPMKTYPSPLSPNDIATLERLAKKSFTTAGPGTAPAYASMGGADAEHPYMYLFLACDARQPLAATLFEILCVETVETLGRTFGATLVATHEPE